MRVVTLEKLWELCRRLDWEFVDNARGTLRLSQVCDMIAQTCWLEQRLENEDTKELRRQLNFCIENGHFDLAPEIKGD